MGERRDERGPEFDDAANGISIRLTAADASGATLDVTAPIDTRPPSRPGALSAIASGTSVSLSWTPAGDDFGVASYSVARDAATIGSTTATGFADTGLAPGATVAYAVDRDRHRRQRRTAGDRQRDAARHGRAERAGGRQGDSGRDGHVRIAWAAATDNIGVVLIASSATEP